MKKIIFCFFCAVVYSNAKAQTSDEELIKALLEKESATWRSGDVKAHADCWLVKPYSRILVSTADGRTFDVIPETMLNPPPGMMGKGGTSSNSNYKMNITGNNAWVSHDEVSIATDGTRTYSYEMRILEKNAGEWKLVAQSIHIYKTEQQKKE